MATIVFIVLIVIVALGALEAAAVAWGVDSRDQMGDDYRR
jgi:hypothetical protein